MLATKCTYSSINKYEELKAYIYEKKPDIILITETWANDKITDAELKHNGYETFHKDRTDHRWGGCIAFVKESLNATQDEILSPTPIQNQFGLI